mmetsp:Transcript_31555/g.86860  ORF Transcript_31555/g.86860 Transcript_31555/m.86860 type:complete len:286 (-) Transcript_31555:222-1079(-)
MVSLQASQVALLLGSGRPERRHVQVSSRPRAARPPRACAARARRCRHAARPSGAGNRGVQASGRRTAPWALCGGCSRPHRAPRGRAVAGVAAAETLRPPRPGHAARAAARPLGRRPRRAAGQAAAAARGLGPLCCHRRCPRCPLRYLACHLACACSRCCFAYLARPHAARRHPPPPALVQALALPPGAQQQVPLAAALVLAPWTPGPGSAGTEGAALPAGPPSARRSCRALRRMAPASAQAAGLRGFRPRARPPTGLPPRSCHRRMTHKALSRRCRSMTNPYTGS